MEFVTYDDVAWKEMSVAIEGADIGFIRGVRYAIESDDEPVYGKGDQPLFIGSGNDKYMGSFRFLKGTLDQLQVAAKSAGAANITKIRFTITVTYDPGDGRPLMVDTLSGCKISKWEKGWEQGAKYMDIDVPITFLSLTTLP